MTTRGRNCQSPLTSCSHHGRNVGFTWPSGLNEVREEDALLENS